MCACVRKKYFASHQETLGPTRVFPKPMHGPPSRKPSRVGASINWPCPVIQLQARRTGQQMEVRQAAVAKQRPTRPASAASRVARYPTIRSNSKPGTALRSGTGDPNGSGRCSTALQTAPVIGFALLSIGATALQLTAAMPKEHTTIPPFRWRQFAWWRAAHTLVGGMLHVVSWA